MVLCAVLHLHFSAFEKLYSAFVLGCWSVWGKVATDLVKHAQAPANGLSGYSHLFPRQVLQIAFGDALMGSADEVTSEALLKGGHKLGILYVRLLRFLDKCFYLFAPLGTELLLLA
ncbi:MAG: hypothetical protein C0429_09775 [Sphingopyxis sp.]|nr:hypothetical protein [Sphingopyxis sp.]